MIQVFTDGSAKKNGSKDAIAGIGVYFDENSPKNISMSLIQAHNIFFPEIKTFKSTNNKAELLAILSALSILKKNLILSEKIEIITDSQYSISSLTLWYKKWMINEWKNSTNKEIINKEIIEKIILEFILKFPDQIEFTHVKSHIKFNNNWDTNKKFLWNGNNRADFLATNFFSAY
jgi:ribonuclease HI